MVEYYAYSIYHGQAAALGGRDRTHGLAVGAFKQSCVPMTHTTQVTTSRARFHRAPKIVWELKTHEHEHLSAQAKA